MQISLRQVRPVFLEPGKINNSQVWNKDVFFHKEEHIHIIAPSGSGKTSLIHFLYGLRSDYDGKIDYDTSNIKNFDAEKFSVWRKQHISIVFQDLRLFGDHSV